MRTPINMLIFSICTVFFTGGLLKLEIDERIVGSGGDKQDTEYQDRDLDSEGAAETGLFSESSLHKTHSQYSQYKGENNLHGQVGEHAVLRCSKTEQLADITPGHDQIVRAEEHPADHDKKHGVDPIYNLKRVFLQKTSEKQPFRYQQYRVHKSPENKCEIGSVPYSGEQKYDHQIPASGRHAFPIAAQRDVHVILEPGGQGDMPSSP